jgi:hypothetical protein
MAPRARVMVHRAARVSRLHLGLRPHGTAQSTSLGERRVPVRRGGGAHRRSRGLPRWAAAGRVGRSRALLRARAAAARGEGGGAAPRGREPRGHRRPGAPATGTRGPRDAARAAPPATAVGSCGPSRDSALSPGHGRRQPCDPEATADPHGSAGCYVDVAEGPAQVMPSKRTSPSDVATRTALSGAAVTASRSGEPPIDPNVGRRFSHALARATLRVAIGVRGGRSPQPMQIAWRARGIWGQQPREPRVTPAWRAYGRNRGQGWGPRSGR